MFWTIPSSKSELQINTPRSVRSIHYMFFEHKNGGLFKYREKPDAITISIDGKVICRNLFLLPFCTTSSDCLHRFNWSQVAASIGLNVNNSDVCISGLRTNDFNIVFVCSDKQIENEKGYDFYETIFLSLKKYDKPTSTSNTSVVSDFPLPPSLPNFPSFDATQKAESLNKIFSGKLEPSIKHEVIIERPISVQSVSSGAELNLHFEYAPTWVFAYPYIQNNSNLLRCYNLLAEINISDGVNDLLPEVMDLSLMSANDKIPYKAISYMFEHQLQKDLKLMIKLTDSNALKLPDILSCDLAVLFGYKKVN